MRKALYGLAGITMLFLLVNVLAMPTPPSLVAPARATRLIIADVAVVDPANGGRTTHGQTVVVEQNRILYVGPPDDTAALRPGQRIDGRGKFLMPGLWDAHVHTLRLAPQLQLPLLIANGVTSVRDMGDTCSWSASLACVSPASGWQRAIAAGEMVGPHLQQVITYHLEEPPADGASLHTLLAALRSRGDRVVKLQLDPTVDAASTDAVLRLADSLGLQIAGHLPFTLDLAANTIGFTSVEHDHSLLPQCSRARVGFDGRTASKAALLAASDSAHCDAVLLAMRTRGTAYVPTHVASTGQDAAFASGPPASLNTRRFVPLPQRQWWWLVRVAGKVDEREARDLHAYHVAALALTKRAHDAGVVVLAGTDALDPEVVHGFALHDELQYLVRAGLTPAQALSTATTAPARFFGVQREVGQIAEGQRADLVLLDANPLVDIRNTARIHTVIFDGRVFGPAERARLLHFVDQQAHRVPIASRLLRGLWYGG